MTVTLLVIGGGLFPLHYKRRSRLEEVDVNVYFIGSAKEMDILALGFTHAPRSEKWNIFLGRGLQNFKNATETMSLPCRLYRSFPITHWER